MPTTVVLRCSKTKDISGKIATHYESSVLTDENGTTEANGGSLKKKKLTNVIINCFHNLHAKILQTIALHEVDINHRSNITKLSNLKHSQTLILFNEGL